MCRKATAQNTHGLKDNRLNNKEQKFLAGGQMVKINGITRILKGGIA